MALGDWLQRRAVPIGPDDATLVPFGGMIGTARVVGLGESFHHTHELLELRTRLVRHLIERHGFGLIVLEAIRPGPSPLDAALDGRAEVESALIEAGARMWRNRETADLLAWAVSHRGAGGALSIHGMDILAPGAAMRTVLAKVELSQASKLAVLSHQFDVDGRADQIAYNALPAEDRALLHRAFRGALARIMAERARYRMRLGDDAHERLVEQAIIVVQALDMLDAGRGGWAKGLPLRDAALAEHVIRLTEAEPDERLIVLSHNMHINAAGPAPALGITLRERFGADYLAVGTAFGQAAFDPPIYGIGAVPKESGESIDRAIGGNQTLLIDLRGDDPPPDLHRPIGLRTSGTGDAAHVVYDAICEAFDILAYVPCITNARQLVETDLALDVAAIDATRAVSPGAADVRT